MAKITDVCVTTIPTQFVIFLYISLKCSDWALNHGARESSGKKSDRCVELILTSLFRKLTEQKLCECAFFARTKRNCPYFKTTALLSVVKYFYEVQVLNKSWKSALRTLLSRKVSLTAGTTRTINSRRIQASYAIKFSHSCHAEGKD
jgi:hypothetical protein